MHFIETAIFTKKLQNLLEEEEYRALQLALLFRPEQGVLIPGAGGLRKLRWSQKGKGKRGGCRVIYYWDKKQETFYMLLAYAKSRQEDLTPAQMKVLTKLVKEELK
ncbi:MAG: type II toxin-antitoxin system RelE/ParE family toxin [Deltaproteobacteria bacterium]|nr:type II toxin-antitoxin system RelE/ParE family toxin [Deltaproteobacteria bacterium]MBW1942868.1 type II toxin-antitoxin system RelE/ParE family toxin [Deltaproteobacteria bacterium]MBW2207712.1 type II toxin-antitoxin system RelE/ParE family toxin [Deltaproteobacteria bacterium]